MKMIFTRIVLICALVMVVDIWVPGGSSTVFGSSTYTVGGTVTGLAGTAVLQNNGEDDLTLTQDGVFTFDTELPDGNDYSITVKAHPSDQTCQVTNDSGTITGSNVTDIEVSCGSCGNEVGNGNEIIHGPNGPVGNDHDSVFRSLTIHPSDPDIILMGTERNGFVKSTDGGTTWTRLRNGLRHSGAGYPEIWDIVFNPTNPSIIYAATADSPGPVTGDYPSSTAGVYKSTDGGQTWFRINCGRPNASTASIQIDANNPLNVMVGVSGGTATFSDLLGQHFDGGIYRSTDGGESWSKVLIHENDGENAYWRIVPYGASKNKFITFGLYYTDTSKNIGFLKSMDSGITWQTFGNSLKSLLIDEFGVSPDGQLIYAHERDHYVIHKSINGGIDWSSTDLIQANGPIAISPTDTQLVLYAGRETLYRYRWPGNISISSRRSGVHS